MNRFIDQCIMCGSTEIKMKIGSLAVKNEKKKITMKVSKIQYMECENCGETYTDAKNEAKIAIPIRKMAKVI